ncbi:uncharacterized protein LOC129579091 isoform X2 [Sitodiplosis mosellana]|uniref:uncharacterized protein LOC129579091 isoform X2 n=1 Tax=Sitodiplosis mosellana TaxID=263140 RepID=UPI002444DED6|nr:uncharacterized protein LOC129579091 isoform X2 [Sitodiplosis mosellana]XP_055324713.1 uncharacterized protein LOC129579091 isoform X2 [Sitodiplosis mosellana]
MRLPQNNIIIAWLLVMVFHSCGSSRYSQLTIVDNTIKNFINEEERFWSDINSSTNRQTANATLERLYTYFDGNLNQPDMGSVEAVRTINQEFAEQIDKMKQHQRGTTKWLSEKRYEEAQQNCDNILSTIPNELSEVFEFSKRPEFLAYIRENSDFCQTNKRFVTPGVEDLNLQNVVTDFYLTVAETLTKGYMTTQMAHMISGAKSQPKKHQGKSIEFRTSFMSQYKTLESNVRSIVQNFTGEIWNCDDFSKDYSYTEITNFVQGYIDNEVNFNQDGTCRKQCSDYQQVEYHVCRNHTLCILNYLDKNKTRCDGQIRSCRFIESDMTLCPNNDQLMTRRYNYIRYNSGMVIGQPQFCRYEVKLKSWIRWFVSCSYCFCYCDHENQFSDRFFSLREATSKIAENKVVTGIRFFKKNRIIHIFISERRILPHGKIEEINSNEITWTGDYDWVIEDANVEADIDYHRLSWNSRAIELDTIRAKPDEVVTGARFRLVNNRIRFEVRVTAYNKETGYLSRDNMKTAWRSNNNHDKEQIPNEDLDVPTLSPEKSKRYRSQDKYIEFTPTGVHQDIAQTTVPFIDTQPVEAKIPKPLIGAGVYYKTTPGYGGFIGPLIILRDD